MGKSERSDGNNCKCYFYLEIVIEFEFQVIKKINDALRKDASAHFLSACHHVTFSELDGNALP